MSGLARGDRGRRERQNDRRILRRRSVTIYDRRPRGYRADVVFVHLSNVVIVRVVVDCAQFTAVAAKRINRRYVG